MAWLQVVEALSISVIASSLTDWACMGALLHLKRDPSPEIWRESITRDGESSAIAYSTLVSAVACAGFILLCNDLRLTGSATAPGFAAAIWAAVVVPLLAGQAIWMKISAYLVFVQALSWFFRLALCSLSVAYFLY